MLPFTKIPFLDAPPIPPKNPRGIDITNAHGHETTKNVSNKKSKSENFITKFAKYYTPIVVI